MIIMSVDAGEARTGIAICDKDELLASPVCVIEEYNSERRLEKVANKVKYFPLEWISESGCDVTPEAIEYTLPLIQGEQNFTYKNGVPQHYVLKCALPRERKEQ